MILYINLDRTWSFCIKVSINRKMVLYFEVIIFYWVLFSLVVNNVPWVQISVEKNYCYNKFNLKASEKIF